MVNGVARHFDSARSFENPLFRWNVFQCVHVSRGAEGPSQIKNQRPNAMILAVEESNAK